MRALRVPIAIGVTLAALGACVAGHDTAAVNPTSPLPPSGNAGGKPDLVLVACDGGTPLWVATQTGSGPWTTVVATPAGRYEISFPLGKGGLIVVDTSNGSVRTNVLYMASDEFAAMIQRTDTTRTCIPRSASVTVTGLRSTDLARVGLGGGSGTVTANGSSTRITDVGARSVSLGAARVPQGAQRADMLILRRDIPFAGPHPVLDFSSAEGIVLDSVPFVIANTGGQPTTLIMSLLSHTSGGAAVTIDRGTTAADGAVPMRRVPLAGQRSGDLHLAVAQTGFPDPRQVVAYTHADTPVAMTLGPALEAPAVSSAGARRPRMQLPSQSAYGTAAQASYFQPSARALTVTISARYLGGIPATWDIAPPDLAAVAGWNPAWALAPEQAIWQANGFGGLLGSESAAPGAVRMSVSALQQGTSVIF